MNLQKFLCLQIQGMHYLLPLQEIKEIIGQTQITPLPNVPKYIKGLINLRGQVISIFDPGIRMGLESRHDRSHREKNCIVICETTFNEKEIKLGLSVDDVLEVQSIHRDQIEPPPHSSNFDVDHKFVSSVVKGEEDQSMLLVLKLESLVMDFLQFQNKQNSLAS